MLWDDIDSILSCASLQISGKSISRKWKIQMWYTGLSNMSKDMRENCAQRSVLWEESARVLCSPERRGIVWIWLRKTKIPSTIQVQNLLRRNESVSASGQESTQMDLDLLIKKISPKDPKLTDLLKQHSPGHCFHCAIRRTEILRKSILKFISFLQYCRILRSALNHPKVWKSKQWNSSTNCHASQLSLSPKGIQNLNRSKSPTDEIWTFLFWWGS